jgi:hypothetical protein
VTTLVKNSRNNCGIYRFCTNIIKIGAAVLQFLRRNNTEFEFFPVFEMELFVKRSQKLTVVKKHGKDVVVYVYFPLSSFHHAFSCSCKRRPFS